MANGALVTGGTYLAPNSSSTVSNQLKLGLGRKDGNIWYSYTLKFAVSTLTIFFLSQCVRAVFLPPDQLPPQLLYDSPSHL